MHVAHEALRRPARGPAGRMSSGPIIACLDPRDSGLTAVRIAGSLARRLASPVLLYGAARPTPWASAAAALASAGVEHELVTPPVTSTKAGAGGPPGGEQAERVLALAHEEGAELVVLASPALPAPAGLSAVHRALAAASPCPVLVVPANFEPVAGGSIVCGVDGSPPATTAARVAAALARRLETRLVLAHASGSEPPASRLLRATARTLRDPAPTYLVAEAGPAAERLAELARLESAQVLVTGSQGRGRSASPHLGSVPSRLALDLSCPLMIVPAGARCGHVAEPLEFATRRLPGGAAALCVQGRIDGVGIPELERQTARLLAETGGRVILDLCDGHASGAEAAALADRVARGARRHRGQVALVVAPETASRGQAAFRQPSLIVTGEVSLALEAVGERPDSDWRVA
jgi:nucleotide-binding universal stress UspA family protein